MALVDRALHGATSAVLDYRGLKDYVSGSTSIKTGTVSDLDPIVSGTRYSCYMTGAGNYITVPTHSFQSVNSSAIELFLWFPPTASGTLVTFNGSPFISHSTEGYLIFTLPYTTPLSVNVDFYGGEEAQIVVNMSAEKYSIYINGLSMATGNATGIPTGSSLVIGNGQPVVFGAGFAYDFNLDEMEIRKHAVEAFGWSPDSVAKYAVDQFLPSDSAVIVSSRVDLPISEEWTFAGLDNVEIRNGAISLDTKRIAEYSSSGNTWTFSDLTLKTGYGPGQVYTRFTHSAGNLKAILWLRPRFDTGDHYHLEITTSNQLRFRRRQFGLDVNDNLSYTTTTQLLSTVTGTTNIGFAWSSNALYVRQNSTLTPVVTSYAFNPASYEAIFGNDETGTNNYFVSRAAWDWELRMRADTTTPSEPAYGPHSFSTQTEAVYSEGSVVVEAPLVSGEVIRKPYLVIDGYSAVGADSLI